jgi:cytochrome c peroxidase
VALRWQTGWLALAALCATCALAAPACQDRAVQAPDLRALRSAYEQTSAAWPAACIDEGVRFVELAAWPGAKLPSTLEHARGALGERLFFDRRLSAEGTVACADCHRPQEGWSVSTPVALGYDGLPSRRNPPTLFSAGWRNQWGWDGRTASLEEQSLLPLTHPREMANPSLDGVWDRVRADPAYAQSLKEVGVQGYASPRLLGALLAAFLTGLERTTRLDRFLNGEHNQLDDQEVWGLHLFRTKARCANCHFGPLLSDEKLHNLGISFFGEPSQDLGRWEVTGHCADAGSFRTASLRHVARTPPYMHNGLFASLRGVVHLYLRGGGEVRARNAIDAADPLRACAAQKSTHLRPVTLTAQELEALLAFLHAV